MSNNRIIYSNATYYSSVANIYQSTIQINYYNEILKKKKQIRIFIRIF